MSYEQIAKELQLSLANIRNQKARGIKLPRENNFGIKHQPFSDLGRYRLQ
jgi:hypothetical protein